MRVTTEEMRHIAALAKVGMSDEEVERMRDQMSSILVHFDVLQDVDTEGVEPTGHSAELSSVMREDEVRESASRQDALANVPHRHDDFIRVRAVLE